MPDLTKYGPNKKTYGVFWRRVWKDHGCYSGLTPQQYFETTLELYDRIPSYLGLGLEIGVERSVGDIIQTLKNTYAIPHIKLEGKYIHEFRFFFDERYTIVDTTKTMENQSIIKRMVEQERRDAYQREE
ncbi:hypothetical protein OROMI_007213 [Orobanche minor]